jgi:protein-tyrosine phosphatase
VIDLHSHILPGVDDGARTLGEARELARRAASEGITAIAATPHVRDDYPTTCEQMESGVTALREDFAAEGIPLEVLPGGEIELSLLWQLVPDELERFSLAGTRRYVLVEFPYWGWPRGLDLAISLLLGRGLRPVLAHPERNPDVQDRPERLLAAVEAGALVQVTAASLDGRLGAAARVAGERLLELKLVHLLASDAHGPHVREAGLSAAAEALHDPELARYLTVEAPATIASGGEVPAPP